MQGGSELTAIFTSGENVETKNVHLMKADPGWYALGIGEYYKIENTLFYQIIAWEFDELGHMKPRTVNPAHDRGAYTFIIQQPDGRIYSYNRDGTAGFYGKDLAEWLECVKLAASPREELARA